MTIYFIIVLKFDFNERNPQIDLILLYDIRAEFGVQGVTLSSPCAHLVSHLKGQLE